MSSGWRNLDGSRIYFCVSPRRARPSRRRPRTIAIWALRSTAARRSMPSPTRRELAGYLVWEPREEPYPVGYYCGIRAPDGNMVEFSYGQPLGPGAREQSEEETDAARA